MKTILILANTYKDQMRCLCLLWVFFPVRVCLWACVCVYMTVLSCHV